MRVEVIRECGIREALFGIGLSYGKTSEISVDDLDHTHKPDMAKLHDELLSRATKLAGMGGGHDKFLRQICVWLDINAPLFWWKQFDTYKVGTVAQSESTMHTLMKYEINDCFFESPIPDATIARLNALREEKEFYTLNNELPQGYLQRRIVSCNYAVLRNIIQQRKGHKLPEWKQFIWSVVRGVGYPEFLGVEEY